mgnify:FL=1
MINYAIEGLTSFTTAPLRWATYIGVITAILAVLYMIYVFYMAITGNPSLQKGWSSMMIIILLFGSLQMIFLGIMGEYLGRIFDETKNRPLYFIQEYTTKFDKKKIKKENN